MRVVNWGQAGFVDTQTDSRRRESPVFPIQWGQMSSVLGRSSWCVSQAKCAEGLSSISMNDGSTYLVLGSSEH